MTRADPMMPPMTAPLISLETSPTISENNELFVALLLDESLASYFASVALVLVTVV
jgi:hypothetical protein